MSEVKVGIIGAGIGQAHLKGYLQVPEARVVAICDQNQERARKLAADYDIEVEIYGSHHEMIEKAGLDAVSVGVPNTLHRPIAVDCLDAGLHVLCEKPLAMSAADGQLIADAAARAGKKCMVGQVNRFRADSLFLKERIVAGELGEIYYSHVGWLRKKGIPGYGGWFTTKALSGGGPLIDIGVHMLDIAWWLAGCPKPVTVSGSTYAAFGPLKKGIGAWGQHNLDGTYDVEDLAAAMIRFDNGLTINLEVSWALHSRKDSQWCQLYGKEGGAEWGIDGKEHAAIFKTENEGNFSMTAEPSSTDAWKGQTGHFVRSILNDTTPDPDVNQGVQMMKMLDGIYESAAKGHEVEISQA
ncbi:MAG TPA: Gfo/Idh/MocA family oxidoreductase [Abditibacteriaceae bacterium]|jgi:predicted dehydrogenase